MLAATRTTYAATVVFFIATVSFGQSTSLALSSASVIPGGTAALALTLNNDAGAQPAALQWTLSYVASDVAGITIDAGSAAAAAGKTLYCNPGTGSTVCLLAGVNSTTMAAGVVAKINVKLASTSSKTVVPITISNAVAASLNGNGIPTTAAGGTLAIDGPLSIMSLTCSPASVLSLGSSTCTVMLSKPAPAGGVIVTLSDNQSVVTLPASVTVPAGLTSASFKAAVGTLSGTSAVNATITASIGTLTKTTTLTVNPSLTVSALDCTASYLLPGASTSCMVTLSASATSAGAAVKLSSNNAQVIIPASVTVAAGTSKVAFNVVAGTFTTDATTQISAALNGSTATDAIALVSASLSAIGCSPATVASGASTTCTVTLSKAALVAVDINVSSSSTAVAVPTVVRVNAGSASAQLKAAVSGSSATAVTLTAALGAITKSMQLNVTASGAPAISSIACTPSQIVGGAKSTCNVTLSSSAPASGSTVTLHSSTASLIVPVAVTVASGSRSAPFTVSAVTTAATQAAAITGTSGTSTASTSIAIHRFIPVSLKCAPNPLTAGAIAICKVDMNGSPAENVLLSVSSSSPTLVRVSTSAVQLPAGAQSVRFAAYSQAGAVSQTVKVTVTLASASAATTIQLKAVSKTSTVSSIPTVADSTDAVTGAPLGTRTPIAPVIYRLVNAASFSAESVCSSGSAATIIGSGFAPDALVTINEASVPVLSASESQVTFECPDVPIGTVLDVNVHAGIESATSKTTMKELTPGVFTINGAGSGHGSVMLSGTVELAAADIPEVSGRPAKPGDIITVYCTGLGRMFLSESPIMPVIFIDGISAEVVSSASRGAGVYEVDVRIPERVTSGDLTLELRAPTIDSTMLDANRVKISVAREP
jgi:trimeric autotransporter adhesin